MRVGFGQGTVEGCDRGVFSGVLPALDLQLLCDVGHGCALPSRCGCWSGASPTAGLVAPISSTHARCRHFADHDTDFDRHRRMTPSTAKRTVYSLDPEAPPHRTRAATARRLLALPLATENGSPRRLVAADATRERIDALTAAGHSLTELSRLIGKPPTSLRRSLSRRSVTVQTAMSVEALYESLGQPCLRRRRRTSPLSHPRSATHDRREVGQISPGGNTSVRIHPESTPLRSRLHRH